MKKLLLLFLLITTTFSYSQESENEKNFKIQKGSWNYSGQISFSGFSDANTNEIGGDLNAQIGYTIKDNLVIGLGFGANRSRVPLLDNAIQSVQKELGISAYTFVKKYIPISEKLAFSLQGELRYSYLEGLDNNRVTISERDRYSIGIRPGLTYFLSKNVALSANFGFLGYALTNDINTNQNAHSYGFNFDATNITFGILLNF